jgi:hypothetical protein
MWKESEKMRLGRTLYVENLINVYKDSVKLMAGLVPRIEGGGDEQNGR